MRAIVLAIALVIAQVAQSANLNLKTRVIWVGQYNSDASVFYFAAEDKDTTCPYTAQYGHYRVEGVNAKGIYSMLLTAATSEKYVSFNILGSCDATGHAIVSEMYYWRE